MPFTVPNATDLVAGTIRSLDQAEPDSLDFQAVGNRRNGVISGADVSSVSSASGNPTPAYLNVTLSACEVMIDGAYGSITSNLTVTVPAAPAGADTRFDVICAYNNSGTFQLDVVSGTISANNPVFPTIPSSKIPLYAVFVKSGENTVNPEKLLIDKRVLSLSSTVRTGTGDPAGTLGSIGDLYLDTAAQAVNTRSGLWVKTESTTWRRLAAYGELTGDVTTVGTTATIANNAVTESKIADSSITSAKILDGTIVNADISASAGITLSKLASGTAGTVVLHNSSGVPTATTISGDVTVSNTGVVTIVNNAVTAAKIADGSITSAKIADGAIVNADISASAGIDPAKIGGGTAAINISGTSNRALTLAQNGSGSGMTFNWSGQGGQPTWLWGSNDGINHYVYNPSNFSVSYAQNAAGLYDASSGSARTINWQSVQWVVNGFIVAQSGMRVEGGLNVTGGISAGSNIVATNEVRAGTYVSANNYVSAGALYMDNRPTTTQTTDVVVRVSGGQLKVNATSYSLRSLKENIEDINVGLPLLKQLKVRQFNWKTTPGDEQDPTEMHIKQNQKTYGFIADEVEEVSLNLVGYRANENGLPEVVTWKDRDMIALLVKAVQELSAEVEALKAAK